MKSQPEGPEEEYLYGKGTIDGGGVRHRLSEDGIGSGPRLGTSAATLIKGDEYVANVSFGTGLSQCARQLAILGNVNIII